MVENIDNWLCKLNLNLDLRYWRIRTKGASDFTQMQDAEVLYVAVNCRDGNSITTYSKLKFIVVLISTDLKIKIGYAS